MMTRKQLAIFLAGIVAMVLVVVVAGEASADSSLDIRTKDGIGSYLVDAKGMTLYHFDKDMPGKSACAGPCVENWPIFYSDTVTVSQGLNPTDFGTITRDDGKKQTTYRGMPLYYFVKDKAPDDTFGQGVKDIWHVVKP